MEVRIIIPNEIYDYHDNEIERLLSSIDEELGLIHSDIYMIEGEQLNSLDRDIEDAMYSYIVDSNLEWSLVDQIEDEEIKKKLMEYFQIGE